MDKPYIDDEDFELYNAKLSEIDLALEEKLQGIIEQVKKACDAISSGNLHDNLCTYLGKLEIMQGKLNAFTLRMQTDAGDYLIRMKEIDDSVVL